MRKSDYARRVIIRPYRRGFGPSFTLTIYDGLVPTYTPDGKLRLAYCLTECAGVKRTAGVKLKPYVVIFEGDDFGLAPGHSSDSDEAVRAIMSFLTLRPGDTDADYFTHYTDRQREFCNTHAEAVAMEVADRFGEG